MRDGSIGIPPASARGWGGVLGDAEMVGRGEMQGGKGGEAEGPSAAPVSLKRTGQVVGRADPQAIRAMPGVKKPKDSFLRERHPASDDLRTNRSARSGAQGVFQKTVPPVAAPGETRVSDGRAGDGKSRFPTLWLPFCGGGIAVMQGMQEMRAMAEKKRPVGGEKAKGYAPQRTRPGGRSLARGSVGPGTYVMTYMRRSYRHMKEERNGRK